MPPARTIARDLRPRRVEGLDDLLDRERRVGVELRVPRRADLLQGR